MFACRGPAAAYQRPRGFVGTADESRRGRRESHLGLGQPLVRGGVFVPRGESAVVANATGKRIGLRSGFAERAATWRACQSAV